MVRGNVQCEYFICTWCWGLKSSHTLYSSKFKVISRIDDCYTEKVHRHFERNKIKIYYSSTPRSTSDRDWQFSDLNLSCHAIKERKWLRKNNEQIDSNITGIPLGAQRWQQLTFIQQEQSLQKKKAIPNFTPCNQPRKANNWFIVKIKQTLRAAICEHSNWSTGAQQEPDRTLPNEVLIIIPLIQLTPSYAADLNDDKESNDIQNKRVLVEKFVRTCSRSFKYRKKIKDLLMEMFKEQSELYWIV